ncbi:50S ribosomal protein L13 [Pseudenhygromyxa sp. WMMC2535]|uniref:50S ribosomal protein L13 n=1 Tax=Pseudenhygromyxa sp. WMMC2535 TaxID=2712867 RepID=UPI0015566CA6|nr:50S ribosomal protein L13 [Pseudenhygromyxa sp. WMMC2535]NVB40730.1 50S ribosomal protein L13 [Pseudenhygromyxa sp. WMMC2535]NVB43877.1 50S ribosomal protein L13 [Pseudenhygromyxa sp. WMMC2535]NVB43884.1 50S ribosomal protein L13 [Pseudenhygromyxa sp. WMMC2535]NVB43889.1 50S ribosomal protein L13 [Pseudenhygromyxa sp. WMMC2535]NVB43891.1 50S ribosomal protein L13 [Pseudenhygromyxa sp. WMMC2535]
MGTPYPNPADIERAWLIIDLEGQTVGRAASKIASLLRGKHKPTFTPHLDAGDFVVCINADKVRFTGNKLDQQTYNKFTGFLGHMKTRTAREMLAKKPEVIISSAVKRMLPKGPLGRKTFKKLKVYAGAEHPHGAQNPQPYQL